ncbi:hypothetical protein O9992_24240 [Vibrio lentus]|nr:hypothetical protein [Vibrio lentus]
MLKDKGYGAVHVGKSHLGDNNDYLHNGTALLILRFRYHLNVMELPEQAGIPAISLEGTPSSVIFFHPSLPEIVDNKGPGFELMVGKQTIVRIKGHFWALSLPCKPLMANFAGLLRIGLIDMKRRRGDGLTSCGTTRLVCTKKTHVRPNIRRESKITFHYDDDRTG